ncbi:hypothetical protein MMPV_007640 [Pyropia vietnamensis]
MGTVVPPTPAAARAAEASAYDHATHGTRVDWNRHCLLIHGVPTLLVCAEVHYFRLPDASRWRDVLLSLRAAGFNAVRLYFHWGAHSPAPGVYHWDGNRDVSRLLALCTELRLLVIAAPGPYICAEVQSGGYPSWLVARRDVLVRHLRLPPVGMLKQWDASFHAACVEWLAAIIPRIAAHERTASATGCVVALQVENELRQTLGGFDLSLSDEVRLLADAVRSAGCTVPLFHNDDSPAGSWATGKRARRALAGGTRFGDRSYRSDLYGFDLYFTFTPGCASGDASSCQVGMLELGGAAACTQVMCGAGGTGVGGADGALTRCLFRPEIRYAAPPAVGWTTSSLKRAVDSLERTMARIGGSAASAPPIVAEGQVGWINQWARTRGYDDVYTFFGDAFSSTLAVSLAAQGVTIANWYMSAGGTNYGCIGDTEVYTSYDYSAFVREYGKLSSRGRRLRRVSLFQRSFAAVGLAACARVADKKAVAASVGELLLCARRAEAPIPVRGAPPLVASSADAPPVLDGSSRRPTFLFLRNFGADAGPPVRYSVAVAGVAAVGGALSPREAAILPATFPLAAGLSVHVATLPVLLRGVHAGSELWVAAVRHAEAGVVVLHASGLAAPTSLTVSWAAVDSSSAGTVTASAADPGATTPVGERVPLDEQPLGVPPGVGSDAGGAPVSLVASTEAIGGLCFTLSIRRGGLVVAVTAGSDGSAGVATAASAPVLFRLLAVADADADSLTAELGAVEAHHFPVVAAGQDGKSPGPAAQRFGVAWGGAEDLAFDPASGELTVGVAAGGGASPALSAPVYLLRGVCDGGAIGGSPADGDSRLSEVTAESGTAGGGGGGLGPVGGAVDGNGRLPEAFAPLPPAVLAVCPGLYVLPPTGSAGAPPPGMGVLSAPSRDLLSSPTYAVPLAESLLRSVDWGADVAWTPIAYADRNPLYHHYTSGHVAYRLRFRLPRRVRRQSRVKLTLNVRHVGTVWVDGAAVAGQVCYSHNAISAGAMHFADVHYAGRKTHDLTPHLAADSDDGEHTVVILVESLGQSRSPFLLNDVRNRRGLLSARLSRVASDLRWDIAGVDVTKLRDPFNTSGLPLEGEATAPSLPAASSTVGGGGAAAWTPLAGGEGGSGGSTLSIPLTPRGGLVWVRAHFDAPATAAGAAMAGCGRGGGLAYPLRLVLDGAPASAHLWINGLLVGRFIEPLGPQSSFYVPDGLLTERRNLLAVAAYAPRPVNLVVRLQPWVVAPTTGNLDSRGGVFAVERRVLSVW